MKSVAVVKEDKPSQDASLKQAAPASTSGHKNPDFKPIVSEANKGAKTK